MRILVTGGGGYTGSRLTESLLQDGHDVICLDRFFFGKDFMIKLSNSFDKLKIIQDDIRTFDPAILEDVDIVCDLAALSNDPVGELNPSKTFDINYLGRSRVAKLAKQKGVARYILPSSASNYGNQKEPVNEDSEVFPLTAYSQANDLAEREVTPLNDQNFSVTRLRFSSIFGKSSRMRFDLAVNNMALSYFKNNKIMITGDGQQYRPFLHIEDAINAYRLVINAEKDLVSGELFNVGDNNMNYKIEDLAKAVGNALGGEYDLEKIGSKDMRSYIASFDKINTVLGFKAEHTVADGAKEIHDALKSGEVQENIKTYTVKWYTYLLEAKNNLDAIRLSDKIL